MIDVPEIKKTNFRERAIILKSAFLEIIGEMLIGFPKRDIDHMRKALEDPETFFTSN